ncbi:MAG TPA: hypothetical protein VMT68_20775 [Caulobacteraceae bacterium]|nr:hypothetical protein [Caulobacteraceae bacterium]
MSTAEAMTRFSTVDAALEGLRVMRREPMAVLYWVGVWAVALTAIAAIRLLTGSTPQHAPATHLSVFQRYGPWAMVLAPAVLALWVMTTATVYRAVLRPGEHGWHLFKLGPDEARIAILSAAETVLIALLGGVPAYLLLVLLNPVFELAPGFSRITAIVGFVLTILIDMWLAVRLSLAPAQTFYARGFPFGDYWGFARGHYWRLLASYMLVALEVLVFLSVSVIVGGSVTAVGAALSSWQGGGLLRRALLWLLVPTAAFLFGIFWVVPLTLVCGCQAYALRIIIAMRPPAPAPGPAAA